MAVRRSQNWVNQQRVDVPHIRSIESAVRNDFDELLEALVIGGLESYVLRGFEINMTGAIGSAASGLQMVVADSAIFHGKSSVSGTFFVIDEGTDNEILNSTVNTKVDGSFTPNAQNYIGIEFDRSIDDSTTSQVYLWNPTNNVEITKTLPLAQVLNYKIVISSSAFASNVLPIGIVETDSANNVLSVTDQRPMLFRLGSAGTSTPDPSYNYGWNNHAEGRAENFWKSTSSTSPFKGGDKQILTLKEWMDAIMTEIKLVKGTAYWYQTASSISLENFFADVVNSKMTGRGRLYHDESIAGQINWDRDIYIKTIGSELEYKILTNLSNNHITLSDGEVAYIDFERETEISPNLIFINGSPIVTSVGAVSWTGDVQANDFIKLISAGKDKYYRIQSVDSVSQVTLSKTYQETSTGSSGTKVHYTWGTYQTNASPSTNRHIKIANRQDVPFDGDTYWLFFRDDNNSAIPKVYVRNGNGAGEIEQGESIEISDNTSEPLIDYIGALSESDSSPNYAGSVDTQEVTKIEFDEQSKMSEGQSWLFESADGSQYYAWYTFDGSGVDPAHGGRTGVQIDLSEYVANFVGQVAGMTTDVTIVADNPGAAGNDISLFFDGVDNINTAISNWNTANPTNTASLTVGDGTQVPDADETIFLTQTGDTAEIIAQKTQLALDALGDFSATLNHNIVYLEDQNNGTPTNASNFDVGGAFYITVPTEGDVSTKFNQQNYNTVEGENLTRRAARLTAMVADKAQDKTIGFLSEYKLCIKETSGSDQWLAFSNTDEDANVTIPYLYIGIPSSSNNGTIQLQNGPVVLGTNEVAYLEVDRNASFSIDLSGLTVSSIASCPLNENVFIFAYRLSTPTVWLWDGTELIEGDNQSRAAISEILNENSYEEEIDIISGVPSGDNELTGPIAAGTTITLPTDKRDAGLSQGYIVGKGVLELYLNGQYLSEGEAWSEVGIAGNASTQFQIDIDLRVGDQLRCRIDTTGGYVGVGGITSGEANDGINVGTGSQVFKSKSGVNLQFRTIKNGANISVSQVGDEIVISAVGATAMTPYHVVSTDYVVQDADGYDVFLVTTGASNRLITLPTAADNVGRQIVVKKIDSGVGFARIRAEGAEYIDDQQGATYSVVVNEIQNQYDSFTYFCDGTQWWVI